MKLKQLKQVMVPLDAIKLLPNQQTEYREKEALKLEKLMKSIKFHGFMIHPVLVDSKYRLIAGLRRYMACKRLKVEAIPCHITDSKNPEILTYEENDTQEPMTPEYRIRLGMKYEAALRALAEADPDQAEHGDSSPAHQAAATAGMSRRTYERGKEVIAAADANPELKPIVDEMNATGKVNTAHRQTRAATGKKPRTSKPKIPKDAGDAYEGEDKKEREQKTDMLGVALPKNLRSTFGACADSIERSISSLRAVKNDVVSMQDWNQFLLVFQVEQQLETIISDYLKRARPHAICPDCEGNADACETCRKCGWLPEWRHKEMSNGTH